MPSGEIDHVWAEQKAEFVKKLSTQLNIPLARIAAVGDSSGDFDMLEIAGIPIYVGTSVQHLQKGWLHLPNANIMDVAQHLAKAWSLKPNNHSQSDAKIARLL